MNSTSYCKFKDLHLTMGSAHGFGGANTGNLYIQGCDFSYIGGGYLYQDGSTMVRYGNGVEFWGNANQNVVDGCRAWEIYDTAFTNQNHTQTASQINIFYINNIIRNCGLASFEVWNRPENSRVENIFILHNTSINPGCGWGATASRPDGNSFHFASFSNIAKTRNLVIKNNIFYTSVTPPLADNITSFHFFLYYQNTANSNSMNIDYNLWSMPSPLWAIGSAASPVVSESLAEWVSDFNFSSHGKDSTPVFADFMNNDFSPGAGSPVIDQGEESIRTHDFNSSLVTGIPDIGAIEQ